MLLSESTSNARPKEIYIIRHGQTDYNRRGVVQGSGIDAPLNEIGRKQAQAFFDKYQHEKFDHVFTSVLQRTQQTVELFLQNGLKTTQLPGFNEINWGVHEGKPMTPEANLYYAGMVEKWNNGEVHLPIEGGESPNEVQKRVSEAMSEVMAKTEQKKVLICMHGRSMRILLSTLLNYPLSHMDTFPHHNTGLYKLVHLGNSYRIEKFNDYSHLNGLA
jgi:probable phosphoglycerate mutase